MDARPLKDVFTDLVGDPSAAVGALAGAGHDLPPDLVAEAVVSFAGTAPAEVAEHLAPYVTANSGVPVESEADWVTDWPDLFATAPEVGEADEFDDGEADVLDAPPAEHAAGIVELAFGAGADDGPAADPDPDLDTGLDNDLASAVDDPADEAPSFDDLTEAGPDSSLDVDADDDDDDGTDDLDG
jgi:hypothetical protein